MAMAARRQYNAQSLISEHPDRLMKTIIWLTLVFSCNMQIDAYSMTYLQCISSLKMQASFQKSGNYIQVFITPSPVIRYILI